MLWKTTVGVVVAGAAICFIGYCFYFDRKRHSDSDFQTKLKERRRKSRKQRYQYLTTELPDLNNPVAVQRYFVQEVQKGEELLATGNIDDKSLGLEHLCRTIMICGQKELLLRILQQTLAPQDFASLEEKFDSIKAENKKYHFVYARCIHTDQSSVLVSSTEELLPFLAEHGWRVQTTMLSKTTFGIAVAGAGICFIGYCFYFDKKRRSDPDFQTKLKERRRKSRQQKSQNSTTRLPDLNNPEAIQRFFLQEVQKGEELLAVGDIPGGVEHLSNAVAVCGQPQQLLQVLQQTLPPQVFAFLVQKLPSVGARLAAAGAGGRGSTELEPNDGLVIDEVVD